MTGTGCVPSSDDLPNVAMSSFQIPDSRKLEVATASTHRPRILLLYGSVRERSYSHFLAMEAQRLLEVFGAETRLFHPDDLPLPDASPIDHPKVAELRSLSEWSEGMVWCSPELRRLSVF